jgi:hypothetical protein
VGKEKEHREHPRLAADQPVVIELLGNPRRATSGAIVDISRGGMRLRCHSPLVPGAPVAISTAEMLCLGEVIWCVGGEAGVHLEQLLDLRQLERLIRRDL